jgi:hypothetical protein
MWKTNLKNLCNPYLMVLLCAITGPIFLLAIAYPLIPTTAAGWAIAFIAGFLIGLWAIASAYAIHWLNSQKRWALVCKAAALLFALSLGIGIFWIALNTQGFITSNTSYFAR